MDLFIKSITGQIEMLTDYEVTRKNQVNGDKYISVKVIETERNKHAFTLIKNENYFIYDNEEFIIKKRKEVNYVNANEVQCTAEHRMFDDLLNNYIYETITGTKRLDVLMSFALTGSGYTYTLITDELPLSVEVENFGDDNSSSLFSSILDKFVAEYEVIGTDITVKKRIGTTTDNQFRYKHNISDPSNEIDTSSFATYIRGYGKQNEDGSYMAQVEYTSPLAEIYGNKHADPVRDERFTANETLLEECKRVLNDSIDISIQLTYIQLKEYGLQDVQLGDYVWCILDPFEIDVRIRIIEKEDYSDPFKVPVFTLGTIKKTPSDIMASFNTTKNKVNKLLTEGGTVKYTFLDTAVKQATEALQSAQTELEFANGIIARDKENSNNIVLFNSAGVGVSTDGGVTFQTAMTAEGIQGFRVVGSDIEGGTITGAELISINSNTQDITEIVGGKINSSGKFSRDFGLEETAEYVSTFDSYNGAVRIGITSKKGADGIERVLTDGRALIYTDKAVSSQRAIHSASVDKKGARFIDFFANETLTSDVQGLGMHIYSGQGMTIESYQGMTIKSDTSFINLQPEYDNVGNNSFSFQVTDSEDVTNTQGLLLYGSHINGYASGIRFSKAASDPVVFAVDGNGSGGGNTTFNSGKVHTNTIRKRDGTGGVYWNGSGTGTTTGTDYDSTLISDAIKTGSINFYVAVAGSGSLIVTNHDGYNSGNGLTYRPVVASEFNPASSILYKENVNPFTENAIDIVKDTKIYTYYLKSDLEAGIYDNQQIGFIAELSPKLRKDDSISLVKGVAISWKGLQEVIQRVENVESRQDGHEEIYNVVIEDLLNRVSKLENGGY